MINGYNDSELNNDPYLIRLLMGYQHSIKEISIRLSALDRMKLFQDEVHKELKSIFVCNGAINRFKTISKTHQPCNLLQIAFLIKIFKGVQKIKTDVGNYPFNFTSFGEKLLSINDCEQSSLIEIEIDFPEEQKLRAERLYSYLKEKTNQIVKTYKDDKGLSVSF